LICISPEFFVACMIADVNPLGIVSKLSMRGMG
jgi:hypothetical protein